MVHCRRAFMKYRDVLQSLSSPLTFRILISKIVFISSGPSEASSVFPCLAAQSPFLWSHSRRTGFDVGVEIGRIDEAWISSWTAHQKGELPACPITTHRGLTARASMDVRASCVESTTARIIPFPSESLQDGTAKHKLYREH